MPSFPLLVSCSDGCWWRMKMEEKERKRKRVEEFNLVGMPRLFFVTPLNSSILQPQNQQRSLQPKPTSFNPISSVVYREFKNKCKKVTSPLKPHNIDKTIALHYHRVKAWLPKPFLTHDFIHSFTHHHTPLPVHNFLFLFSSRASHHPPPACWPDCLSLHLRIFHSTPRPPSTGLVQLWCGNR